MKKSQITVFIIIAVIIVVSFIALMLFFYGRDDDLEEHKDPVDIERINNFVEECIFQTGEDAVYRIGRTGGYSEASKYSTSNDIAYYYDKGRNLLPPKSEIENQLALYIKSNLNSCIKDFSDFPTWGLLILILTYLVIISFSFYVIPMFLTNAGFFPKGLIRIFNP